MMNPDFTTIPAPQGTPIENYWPVIILSVTLLTGTAGAIWAAWISLRNKKHDLEHQSNEMKLAEQRDQAQARFIAEQQQQEKRWEIECRKLQLDFDRQKNFQDDLIGELREEKKYTRELIEANREYAGNVMERDQIIRTQNEQIALMSKEIAELKAQVAELSRHVKSLEVSRREGRS